MRQKILDLHQAGYSYSEIAAALWTTRSAVAGHIDRHRKGYGVRPFQPPAVPVPPKDRRDYASQRGPNRAIDPDTRRVVSRINKSKLTDQEIADISGVSLKTIWRWRKGTHVGQKFLLRCVSEVLDNENKHLERFGYVR